MNNEEQILAYEMLVYLTGRLDAAGLETPGWIREGLDTLRERLVESMKVYNQDDT